jgi:hypothetical protein
MKILGYIYSALLALLAIVACWAVISWVDIIADNNYPNPVHHEYNFFTVVFGDE